MPFKPGESGNLSGKPKGAVNKSTLKLRESITCFLEDEFENVKADFQKLEPKERLKFYTDLLQFGLPKLQATSMALNFEDLTDDQIDEIINQLMNKA
ncbi:MAG: hypothetical protein WKF97_13945 [Chitinophagaceae bacterium]